MDFDLTRPTLETLPAGGRDFVPNYLQLFTWRMRRKIESELGGRRVNAVLHWARRAGKTIYCGVEAYNLMVLGQGNFSMVVNDIVTGQDNWREIFSIFGPIAARASLVTAKEIELVAPEDGAIPQFARMVSGGKSSTGRGAAADVVLFDEAQMIPPATVSRVIPAIVAQRGVWFKTLTPPSTEADITACEGMRVDLNSVEWHANPICRWGHVGDDKTVLFVEAPIQAWMLAHKFYVEDMRANRLEHDWLWYCDYAAEEIIQMRGQMNRQEAGSFERECLLQWDKAQTTFAYRDVLGQVGADGQARACVTEEADFAPEGGDVFVTADTGGGKSLTVYLVCQQKGDGFDVIDEFFAMPEFNEEDMCADVLATMIGNQSRPEFMQWAEGARRLPYPFPAWATGDVRAPRTSAALKRAVGDADVRHVGQWDGYRNCRMMFMDGKLRVHPRCVTLIRNLQNWRYNQFTHWFSDTDCDAIQCLQYGAAAFRRRTGGYQTNADKFVANAPSRIQTIEIPILSL